MSSKKWLYVFIIFVFIILFIVGFINYLVDPIWSFSHENKFNRIQKAYDERHNKTNYIYNNGLSNYNGLLFGSSRTTHINQKDFVQNFNIYNYACASMDTIEYNDYIEFSKKIKGKDFNYIIIGLDFFNTNKYKNSEIKNPNYYINKVQENFYKYKLLFSYDTFIKSIKNIKYSLKGRNEYYDRNNIHHSLILNERTRLFNQKNGVVYHTEKFMGTNYIWDDDYINRIKQLKINNPNTKFIIFTSPISAELLYSIIKNADKMNEYKRWLFETVLVFEEIYHFMYFNKITTNLKNYSDSSHYYPFVGEKIVNEILYNNQKFGIKLNKNNLEQFFMKFELDISSFRTKFK